jgi:hypothetical protein
MLPNLDFAVNVMDESRVVVPWEEMSNYAQIEARTRRILLADEVISQYGSSQALEEASDESTQVSWMGPGEPYWNIARGACPPPQIHLGDIKPPLPTFTGRLLSLEAIQVAHIKATCRTRIWLGTLATKSTCKNLTEHS